MCASRLVCLVPGSTRAERERAARARRGSFSKTGKNVMILRLLLPHKRVFSSLVFATKKSLTALHRLANAGVRMRSRSSTQGSTRVLRDATFHSGCCVCSEAGHTVKAVCDSPLELPTD